MKESLGTIASGVVRSISEGDIFIYSYSAQLISFEIDSISKEINCAEHEYMNMSPSLIELATPLIIATRIVTETLNSIVAFYFKCYPIFLLYLYSIGRDYQSSRKYHQHEIKMTDNYSSCRPE